MARLSKPPRSRVYGLTILAIALIGPATLYTNKVKADRADSIRNYKLHFAKPPGWVEVPHSPQTLFSYRDPKTNVSLRGAANQIVHDENPTPELDRDGLTKQFQEVTVDNLGWQAKILDVVECNGGSYRLIRRETSDRTVFTGIAVKGNTTVLITLTGSGKAKANTDLKLPMFREYLAATSLSPTVLH